MGTKKNPGEFDCYEKALPTEPMFHLLARDKSAPDLIEAWAARRKQEIKDGDYPIEDLVMVDEAIYVAIEMRRWRKQNDGAWRIIDVEVIDGSNDNVSLDAANGEKS